jgi:hypothetical protein
MNIINLTPNSIKLPNGKTIQPSGIVARSNPRYEQVGEIMGVPLLVSHTESISNVPEAEAGTLLIVPTIVRVAMPKRRDLISPCKLIRDGNTIVGCSSFETNK